MQRNFLRGLLICLLPCALFGAFAVIKPYRKGIDLAGGTILTYQVDLEKAKKRKELEQKNNLDAEYTETGLSHERMAQLAESLKRRIDPADLMNVIIRPVGDSRVEIILPLNPGKGAADGTVKEGASEDFVQFVKNVVAQVGVLEFRILANETDDVEAFAETERLVNGLSTEEADKLAKAGDPPPAPREKYTVKIGDDEAQNVEYQWLELSKEERESLGLTNAVGASTDVARKELWNTLAANRGKTYRRTFSDRGVMHSMLLYSREFTKEYPTKDEEGKKVEYYVLSRLSDADTVKIEGDVTLTAYPDQDEAYNRAIGFRFNGAGAQKFSNMTRRNRPSNQVMRYLAVVLDDKVVSAPTLNSQLSGGGIIKGGAGGMKEDYVNRIVYILRSRALTAALNPTPVSENTVGPTLGQDTIRKGLTAVGLAFSVVLGFMVFYYRFAGLVACVALLANLLLTVGFMVAVNAAFTLAGLAGIVLMLGMAVDANVLIYERLREERARGATIAAALRNGYDRAFLTIIDTHLTSIFTAIVLYTFGNDNLKGFSISLTVGLIISLFTSLYMTRLIFDYRLHMRKLTELRMLQLFPRPRIDFMALRKPMFALTAILSVVGLGLFLYRGEKGLNVDFRGGTMYGGRLEKPLPLSGGNGLLDLVSESRQRDKLKVKEVYRAAGEGGDEPGSAALRQTYYVEYEGSPRVTVTLATPPEGATWDAQKEDLKRRASGLPDVSVEQVFISGLGDDFASLASRSFSLKTTEKEPALVQVILDRLLRDNANTPLLATTTVQVPDVTGPAAVLEFSKPTSEGYVRELLTREFNLANSSPRTGQPFALQGDQATQKDGKFTRIAVNVTDNNVFVSLRDSASAGALVGGPGAIAGKATQDKADLQSILTKFKASFESRPMPEQLQTFDATLAADTRTKALYAILASWVAILLYLWFRFGNWTFGLAAVLCLVHDLCFTLGAIAACHYLYQIPGLSYLGIADFKIDLVAVAALLTLVGYSVNEIIVNFARIREVRGKNPLLTPQMINDSVNQTLSRTILTSTTVFLVSFVLFAFGGEGVHLFAFVMVMGVLISTYSSIFVASPLLLIFGEGKPVVRLGQPAVKETMTV